jgi:hypothetical protein
MSDDKALAQLVEEAVDKGATTAEEIHRAIADLPVTMLDRLGVQENAVKEVRKISDASIGAIYDLIRDINRKVATLASELLDEREGAAPKKTAASKSS